MCEPDGRRPGRALPAQTRRINISPNGRRYATLPEPIERARVLGHCELAGEGNVVERSERYASEAKPEEPMDTNDERVPRLLAAVQNVISQPLHAERPEGEAWTFKAYQLNKNLSHQGPLNFPLVG